MQCQDPKCGATARWAGTEFKGQYFDCPECNKHTFLGVRYCDQND